MKEKTTICQRLTEEGADPVMLEQYQRYQKTGNIQGQCGLICRFRRKKSEELKKGKEQLACLDYMIAKVEKSTFVSGYINSADYCNCGHPVLEGDKDSGQCYITNRQEKSGTIAGKFSFQLDME